MKTKLAPLDRWTASNGVTVHYTRRVDVGPALMVDGNHVSPQDVLALREYFAQDADPHSRDHCRCGVYRYPHDMGLCDHPFRKASRLRTYLQRHSMARHARAWAWWHLTSEKYRWERAEKLHARRPELCWCQMVDAILLQGAPDDYRAPLGDLCEVPLLSEVQPFRLGQCYCSDVPASTTGSERG